MSSTGGSLRTPKPMGRCSRRALTVTGRTPGRTLSCFLVLVALVGAAGAWPRGKTTCRADIHRKSTILEKYPCFISHPQMGLLTGVRNLCPVGHSIVKQMLDKLLRRTSPRTLFASQGFLTSYSLTCRQWYLWHHRSPDAFPRGYGRRPRALRRQMRRAAFDRLLGREGAARWRDIEGHREPAESRSSSSSRRRQAAKRSLWAFVGLPTLHAASVQSQDERLRLTTCAQTYMSADFEKDLGCFRRYLEMPVCNMSGEGGKCGGRVPTQSDIRIAGLQAGHVALKEPAVPAGPNSDEMEASDCITVWLQKGRRQHVRKCCVAPPNVNSILR